MPAIHIKSIKIGKDAIDIHRHVNNQEYLRWMQEIAIEHSTLQGWPMERYLQCGSSWYVKSHFIEYLKPVLLGDTLLTCTWISGMDQRSSPRRTLFIRSSDRRPVARAETRWIFVSLRNGRPKPIPDELREAFTIVDSDERAQEEIDRLLAEFSGRKNAPDQKGDPKPLVHHKTLETIT